MSLYTNRSMIPSTRCNGPTPSREKHPHTIMFPPPCFTVGNMYLTFILSPFGRRTYRMPSEANKLNFDSSLQTTRDRYLVVQWLCSIANRIRAFWFFRFMYGFFAGRRPNNPASRRRCFVTVTLVDTLYLFRISVLSSTAFLRGSAFYRRISIRSSFSVVFRGLPDTG